MTLPVSSIIYRGREVRVRLLEQINDTALYIDKGGVFYTVYIKRSLSLDDAVLILKKQKSEVRYPDDKESVDAISKPVMTVQKCANSKALNWYVREFLNEGPLKMLMRKAVNQFKEGTV